MSGELIHDLLRVLRTEVVLCLGLGGSIHLVERRGKTEKLDPRRQVEISTLLESIPEAAIIIDAGGQIVEANSAAAHLVSSSREQLRGRQAEQFKYVLQASSDPAPEPVVSRALQGQVVRNQRRLVRSPQSGVVQELLVSANPVRNEAGETIAALVIARDVTELRQLQQRVGDIERHRAIGQMAAALAHDFNNILGTISQAAALLEINAERSPAERKPLLDMIQNTVRRGAEIVARVREYQRTGSGALGPVNICRVIQEAVELTRPLWQKSDIRLTMRLHPVSLVRTNDADLRRVFTNLIINAVEATPRGGELTIACEERESQVFATVSDTGEGIPPENLKKIFFPYFTTKPGGTGLGLSGAQKILLSHGGNITVASEPGKGATFTVILPTIQSRTEDSAAQEEA